jgi:hypothetical protein
VKRPGAGALAGWWPAGLVPGLCNAALDSSLRCREEARLAAGGSVAGRSRGHGGPVERCSLG